VSTRGHAPGRASPRVLGVDPSDLDDEMLLHHLASLHRTRLQALRHAPERALVNHLARTGELEVEYLRRHPAREGHNRRRRF
jgi:hypothetical protein